MPDRSKGYIYFIEAKGADRVKIGWTIHHPQKRFWELQVASPFPLEPLGVIVGVFEQEDEIHRLFAEFNITGEWFTLSDPIREFISRNVVAWPERKHSLALVPTATVDLRDRRNDPVQENFGFDFEEETPSVGEVDYSFPADRLAAIVRANGYSISSMSLAAKVGITRKRLYELCTSRNCNPEWKTVVGILGALGETLESLA